MCRDTLIFIQFRFAGFPKSSMFVGQICTYLKKHLSANYRYTYIFRKSLTQSQNTHTLYILSTAPAKGREEIVENDDEIVRSMIKLH